jgi:hypothetical protein
MLIELECRRIRGMHEAAIDEDMPLAQPIFSPFKKCCQRLEDNGHLNTFFDAPHFVSRIAHEGPRRYTFAHDEIIIADVVRAWSIARQSPAYGIGA